jgi:hypothetical protein
MIRPPLRDEIQHLIDARSFSPKETREIIEIFNRFDPKTSKFFKTLMIDQTIKTLGLELLVDKPSNLIRVTFDTSHYILQFLSEYAWRTFMEKA